MRATAAQRELEIVRGQLQTAKRQLQQLQELLAAREQEHRYRVSTSIRIHRKLICETWHYDNAIQLPRVLLRQKSFLGVCEHMKTFVRHS